MVVPVGARHLLRGAADRRRGLPRAEAGAARARPRDRRRRRGRLRARPRRRARRRSRRSSRRPSARATASASRSRSTRRRARSSRTARYRFEGRDARTGRDDRASGAASSTRYPIVSIEDGAAEDDWDAWAELTTRARRARPARRRRPLRHEPRAAAAGDRRGVGNSILVKVNQIGTLTETIEAIRLAQANGYTAVMSHRSGETEDATIADLAVALGDGPDQDRRARALRPRREVQPAAADRGGARRAARVPGLGRVSARPLASVV